MISSTLYTLASLKLLCTTSSAAYLEVFKSYHKALVSLKLQCTTGGLVSRFSASSTFKDQKGSISTCGACFEGVALLLQALASLII